MLSRPQELRLNREAAVHRRQPLHTLAAARSLREAIFAIFVRQIATRGILLLPQVMIGTAVVVIFIVIVASLMSIRKVLVLEPAVVFRG